MNRNYLHILVYFLLGNVSFGQSILDQYIQEGLTNNQSINQQHFAFEKSVFSLKEARSLFMPKITFMTEYFLAGGGRTIEFPTGDLLNSAYSTLNELTNSNSFPQLDNQSILLNPNNFYDAKLRTTLPLLNLEIEYNRRIKEEELSMQQIEINLYKRELIKEIKVAYFTYLKAVQTVKIYDMALEILGESRRVNESLFRNDRANRTVVLRAKNEIVKFESLRVSAQQNSSSAQAYFNFLLNKNLDDPIKIDSSYQSIAIPFVDSSAVSQREELLQLEIANNINKNLLGLSQSFIVPKVSAFLDIGFQGFDWQFNSNSRYYLFGVSLQWDLFSSGRNQFKVQQVKLDNKILQSQTEYVGAKLKLQFVSALNEYNSSVANYQSSVSFLNTSRVYHADIILLYREGKALYIELLDAQNQLLQAELQVNISLFETYIKAAEIERANAGYQLK